jgi:hypothetical protein
VSQSIALDIEIKNEYANLKLFFLNQIATGHRIKPAISDKAETFSSENLS